MRALFSCSVLLVTSLSVFACSGGDSGLDVNQDGSAAGTGAVGSGAVSGGGSGGTLSGTGASAGTGATAGTGGVVSGTGATGGTGGQATEIVCTSTCTDTPRDTESCQQAQEWGFCSEDWFAGYCEETCGTCSGEEVCMEVPVTGTGGGGSGGNSGSGGGSGGTLSNDNPYTPLSNAPVTHGTRYWDCCKPSCGWTGQGSTHSCDLNNNDVGVNDSVKSVCDGGDGQTCHGMAPWAHSTEVSYGFAAANGRPCGACYQLQFTGQGEHNVNDPGSQAIAGKTMIVKVTNRGGELGDGHFDLLIPGGGLGAFNGCTKALGIPEGDMGAKYGGFMQSCGGDLGCVRNECNSTFANFPELRDGCLWFVDWFKGADNPKFMYQEIQCPADLGGFD